MRIAFIMFIHGVDQVIRSMRLLSPVVQLKKMYDLTVQIVDNSVCVAPDVICMVWNT